MNHDVDSYLAGKPPAAVELFRRFPAPVLAAGERGERVHRTTTRKVYTHRFTFTDANQLDADIGAWLVEAHDDVGPRTR